MTGDDAVRFCGQCQKNVYNVAALSRAEAVALIDQAEGRICMQLTRRADGTIATGDCWAQLRRARKRGLVAFAAALPLIFAAQLWSQGFGLRALAEWFRGPSPCTLVSRTQGLPVASPPARGDVALPPEHHMKGEIAVRPALLGKVLRGHTSTR